MKMPRSHCENENVQFVQELAEVDGPFESPININFRDLTKLELPSLVWNHCEMPPKKMKITNTGHTVIISGKWKCERPFLTGGPLSGKYVFSQIHFHWGQDDCKGSEHQVCGEGFPLEMHVAHFKADYETQENALREKDGMVVVVYLFKLQDEPNAALKKILSCLPHVKQASTSQVIDPRPILSLCNPFTDDYFMYWGSVVTPTCAHILLWIVCREPFGISRDQVNEFRKLCDTAQKPICRNNRDPQPLHRRNVFHVNASKNLDDPLLPIKKMMGCYCKGSEENLRMKSQAHLKNQEDIEGNITENKTGYKGRSYAGSRGMIGKISLPQSFYVRRTFMVQKVAVKSVPQLCEWRGNDIIPQCGINNLKSEAYSNVKNISQSCCFLPYKEGQKTKIIEGKRKIRGRKQPLASLKALSHIMNSLEALKNHTVKKLKEIESINQEIKGMKPLCQDSEDKRWLRRVEKMMSRQKRSTVKASKGCLVELKKLARECNFDKFFDSKALPVKNTEINQETVITSAEFIEQALPCSEACVEKSLKESGSLDKTSSKPLLIEKDAKLSAKAQKLIQSFFEDIKETEELQQTIQKDLQLKKINSFGARPEQAGDSTPDKNLMKGFITQKMFNLGNLGDRFFAEVTSEDNAGWGDKVASNGLVVFEDEIESKKSVADKEESDKAANTNMEEVKVCSELSNQAEEVIPLHRTNVTISLSKPTEKIKETGERLLLYKNFVSEMEPELPELDGFSGTESTSCSESFYPREKSKKKDVSKSIDDYFRQQIDAGANYKLTKHLKADDFLFNLEKSSSNLSTDSTDTQQMIIAKFHKRQSRKEIWKKESSTARKVSSKALYGKTSWRKFRNKLRNINVEGYYIRKKNLKHKRKKGVKNEGVKTKRTPSLYERSSTSKDDLESFVKKSKWKSLAKTKFKLEIKKTSDSTLDSEIEYSFLSPERKKLKLECKKAKGNMHRRRTSVERTQMYVADDDPRTVNIAKKSVKKTRKQENVDLYLLKGNDNDDEDDEDADSKHGVANMDKSNVHLLELHPRNLTRIHIPRSSANETRANSRESTKKTARATSVDSKSSGSDIPESNQLNTNNSPRIFNSENKKGSPSFSAITIKNRSFTSMTARPKDRSSETCQRVFVESIDLRMTGKEAFEQRRKPNSPRQEVYPKVVTPRTVSRETSNENNRKLERKVNQGIPEQEFSVEFFTSAFQSESLNKGQQEKGINTPLKRCDTDKYYFLEKVLDEKSADGQDSIIIEEKSRPESVQGDANIPHKPDGPSMKGDAVISTGDTKELQKSVSYSGQKKNPQSRSHSAESLNSMKKVCRRKGKKRPHCCKRNSRHYIKKNSSFNKKLNKTDNRTINVFGLTEEEQLKIISVNVAKYLEQKLVEGKTKFEPKDESFPKETETVLKNIKGSQEKSSPRPSSPPPPPVVEIKQEEIPIVKPAEKPVKKEKLVEPEHSKADGTTEIKLHYLAPEKKSPPSPRPVHNFIKLNKLMAGKYKRSSKIPVGKIIKDSKKKSTEFPKEENTKPKLTRKKRDKPYPSKRLESIQDDKTPTGIQKVPNKTNNGKTTRGKSSPAVKKKDSEQSKIQGKPSSPLAEKKVRKNQEVKTEGNSKQHSSAPLVVQKISQAKNRQVPAYMLTSYLPAPIEIVEKQQQKMNRYLLNMNAPNMKDYLTDVLNETQMKNRKKKNGDAMLSKELEYLISLQMCLNNDISTNMENSRNYVKTLLGQDYNGPLLDIYEPLKKGVILTEMNESLDCSSSNSDYTEDSDKRSLTKTPANGTQKPKTKSLVSSTTANESGDSQMIDSTFINGYDVTEEWNSDSGYNCEISITLNAGSVDGERDTNIQDMTASKNSMSEQGGDSSYKTEQNQTIQSCSQISLKPHRKKRKENEISIEMKQKLLEILEEEIKREMEASYLVQSENSSDTVTWKWEDSDLINRVQSTDSSSDNIEVLTQISETMRQYLTEFIERRLAARKDEQTKDKDVP